MAQRSRFQSHRQSPSRQTTWVLGPFNFTPAVTGTGSSVSGTASQALVDGLTLVRVRGSVAIDLSDVPILGTNSFNLAMGLAIVSENAAGIGATAIPDPLVDAGWDGWFWHWMGIAGTAPGVTAAANGVQYVEIDSKAMRKWKNTDVMVAVIGTFEIGTAGSLITAWNTRLLVKLP